MYLTSESWSNSRYQKRNANSRTSNSLRHRPSQNVHPQSESASDTQSSQIHNVQHPGQLVFGLVIFQRLAPLQRLPKRRYRHLDQRTAYGNQYDLKRLTPICRLSNVSRCDFHFHPVQIIGNWDSKKFAACVLRSGETDGLWSLLGVCPICRFLIQPSSNICHATYDV